MAHHSGEGIAGRKLGTASSQEPFTVQEGLFLISLIMCLSVGVWLQLQPQGQRFQIPRFPKTTEHRVTGDCELSNLGLGTEHGSSARAVRHSRL